jgi:hypothetical protein
MQDLREFDTKLKNILEFGLLISCDRQMVTLFENDPPFDEELVYHGQGRVVLLIIYRTVHQACIKAHYNTIMVYIIFLLQ